MRSVWTPTGISPFGCGRQPHLFRQRAYGSVPPAEVVHEQTGWYPSSPRKLTGLNKNEDITLKRGVTHDTTFSTWASQVWDFGSGMGSEVSSANFSERHFSGVLQRDGTVGGPLQNLWLQCFRNPGSASWRRFSSLSPSSWAQKHPGTIGSNLPKFAAEVQAVRDCLVLWVAVTHTIPLPAQPLGHSPFVLCA